MAEEKSGADNGRAKLTSGFVYFLRCSNAVKIGFSRDPDLRVKTLSNSNPTGLDLIALHPGTRRDESRLHDIFARYRRHGEWFDWSDEIGELATKGFEPISDDLQDRDPDQEEVLVAPIVAAVARKLFPSRTSAELATRAGVSVRMGQYWLTGRSEIGARSLAALLVSDMGDAILSALRASNEDFVR